MIVLIRLVYFFNFRGMAAMVVIGFMTMFRSTDTVDVEKPTISYASETHKINKGKVATSFSNPALPMSSSDPNGDFASFTTILSEAGRYS